MQTSKDEWREMIYKLYFDGSCKGPQTERRIGMGLVIYRDDNVIFEKAWTQDDDNLTNNVAEYKALMYGLFTLKHIFNRKEDTLEIYGDSKLVIEQVQGNWKVDMKHLKSKTIACQILIREMGESKIKLEWIPREQNKIADKLAQDASDGIERCSDKENWWRQS